MAKEYITYYQWGEGAIHQIEVRQQDNGRAVAYIAADTSDAAEQTRHNIRSAIRLMGWGTLSDHRDGKFMLRVTGLQNGEELISMLQGEGFITGAPKVYERESIAPKQSLGQWLQGNSLKVSGFLATIGNILGISQGIHRSLYHKSWDYGQIGKNVFFSMADMPLLLAGEKDDARQLGDLLRHLRQHYDKEGIEIPQNASILVETSDRGKSFLELSKDYLHRYANQIKCSFEVAAAVSGVFAGKKQDNKFKKYSPLIWGTGFFTSLMIPERKIDPEKYAQANPIQRLWMRIQEHPLAIGGTGGYSNNIADFIGSNMESKKWIANGRQGPQFFWWDRVTPSVMLGANTAYAISQKSAGGAIGEKGIESDVYSIAAQILNKQPEDVRQKAMLSTADFLGQRTEIRDTKEQIIVRLAEEMKIQRENPWFEKQGLPDYIPRALHLHDSRDAAPVASAAEATIVANDNGPQTTISTHEARLALAPMEALASRTIH